MGVALPTIELYLSSDVPVLVECLQGIVEQLPPLLQQLYQLLHAPAYHTVVGKESPTTQTQLCLKLIFCPLYM